MPIDYSNPDNLDMHGKDGRCVLGAPSNTCTPPCDTCGHYAFWMLKSKAKGG